MVDQRSLIAPLVAKRILRTKRYVIQMFEYSLTSTKIHNINLWLNFSIPKFGLRKVVSIIEDLNDENNKLIEKTIYYLPRFISDDDTKSSNLLSKLTDKLKERE